MPTSSRGSNFFTMPRYSSTQAMISITRFCQPPVVKPEKMALKPEPCHRFNRISPTLIMAILLS